jgi:hypothetical protein
VVPPGVSGAADRSDELWQAVHARLGAVGGLFARTRQSGRLLGRPSFTDSSYLLTGFAKSSECGGALTAEGRGWGPPGARSSRHVYVCATYRRRGATKCSNHTPVRHDVADAAVLGAIARVLEEGWLDAALERALARIRARQDRHAEDRATLVADLAAVDRRIQRSLDLL